MRIYIYNKNWIAVTKVGDERYNLLKKITNFTPILHQPISVKIPLDRLDEEIERMLPFRLQDTPEYGNRFRENDIFRHLIYKNKSYKLCNTGFDSSIIFLIDIYNAGIENSNDIYIIYAANNHKEFEEWKRSFDNKNG